VLANPGKNTYRSCFIFSLTVETLKLYFIFRLLKKPSLT
jgi:hypothetical protein